MQKRAAIQIYVAIIVIAVTVPAYARWSFAPDQRLNIFTSACEASMIPAFHLAAAVLPVRTYDSTEDFARRFNPVSDARIYFCVLTGMNVLFWTAMTTFILLAIRLLQRRHTITPSI